MCHQAAAAAHCAAALAPAQPLLPLPPLHTLLHLQRWHQKVMPLAVRLHGMTRAPSGCNSLSWQALLLLRQHDQARRSQAPGHSTAWAALLLMCL